MELYKWSNRSSEKPFLLYFINNGIGEVAGKSIIIRFFVQ
jgi:hypothetical protein